MTKTKRLMMLICGTLFLSTLGTVALAQATRGPSAVAHWTFDSISGGYTPGLVSAHDALLVNGGSLDTAVLDDGMVFGGSNYLMVGLDPITASDPNLNIGVDDFSVTFWLKTDSTGYNNNQILLRKGCCERYFGVQLAAAQGTPALVVATTYTNGSFYYSPTGADLRDGDWHFVAITLQQETISEGRIYVDGELIHTFYPSGYVGGFANPDPLRIGYLGNSYYYEGEMDDLMFFDEALTATEVYDIATEPNAYCCAPSQGCLYTDIHECYQLSGQWEPWADGCLAEGSPGNYSCLFGDDIPQDPQVPGF